MTRAEATALAYFHLTYRPLGDDVLLNVTLDTAGLDAAYAMAGDMIAEAHGMTGAHVAFDHLSRQVTVGAGYRAHRGTFTIEPIARDAGEVMAAGEVESLRE
jgi:hypothetical protein